MTSAASAYTACKRMTWTTRASMVCFRFIGALLTTYVLCCVIFSTKKRLISISYCSLSAIEAGAAEVLDAATAAAVAVALVVVMVVVVAAASSEHWPVAVFDCANSTWTDFRPPTTFQVSQISPFFNLFFIILLLF
jgi:hypothetical protein